MKVIGLLLIALTFFALFGIGIIVIIHGIQSLMGG